MVSINQVPLTAARDSHQDHSRCGDPRARREAVGQGNVLQTLMVALIEAVGGALTAELNPFLPGILPLLLKVFTLEGELIEKRMGTQMKIFDRSRHLVRTSAPGPCARPSQIMGAWH